ncbi:hypothetical protein M271_28685 [Streptomyces rapamycinicus NRRL 5491]|nr:hypothetical protein M271_28685 [Streptomyces rapamycinicus NRRL 5491]
MIVMNVMDVMDVMKKVITVAQGAPSGHLG